MSQLVNWRLNAFGDGELEASKGPRASGTHGLSGVKGPGRLDASRRAELSAELKGALLDEFASVLACVDPLVADEVLHALARRQETCDKGIGQPGA